MAVILKWINFVKKIVVFKTATPDFSDTMEWPADEHWFKKEALDIFYNSDQYVWLKDNGYTVTINTSLDISTLQRHLAMIAELPDEVAPIFAILFGDRINAPLTP